MKKIITAFAVLISTVSSGQVPDATVREYKQIMTTYPYSDPNPIPQPTSLIYPHYRFDGYTNTPVQKEWKVVELENDYIKVLIFPEIGGKVWTAIEKSTGRPFLYGNGVVKFRDIAQRGPWTSGGLETNYGVIGHTTDGSTPVDYTVTKNDDGSVSCVVGTIDLPSRTTWRLEVNLPKDKAYFTTKTFWHNSTPLKQPYYHWMCAGIPVDGDLEFIFPGTGQIGHNGEYGSWPLSDDRATKRNIYAENNYAGPRNYHVLGKHANFFGAYWHDYNFGSMRYASRDDKVGTKVWIWGLSDEGMIWDRILTDKDGQYAEIQSGRQFNQNNPASVYSPFKHLGFAPYGTDTWTEYWYPMLDTKGAVEANEYGALNVVYEGGWLKLYFSPVQSINDKFEIKDGDRTVYSKHLKLQPLQMFKDSIKIAQPSASFRAALADNKLEYKFDLTATDLSRPMITPDNFDWTSAYGLYTLGSNQMNHKDYANAHDNLKASLEKDPNYLPALVSISQLMYHNMCYQEALDYAMRALSIDAQHGEANYYYGLINKQLVKMYDSKDGFEMASISHDYRSAACTELSTIYLKEKNFRKSLLYAQKAIDCNSANITALQLMAVSYRLLNDTVAANEVLNRIEFLEKLSHFVNFERSILQPTKENESKFIDLIKVDMSHETFVEMGIWYYNIGCVTQAEKLFSNGIASAEAIYWLSYMQNKPVDFTKINPSVSFPYRSETAGVMSALLKSEKHWLLKYQLALIYANRNRIDEAKELLISCDTEADFAPLYAVRAKLVSETKFVDLKRAVSLDNDWRYVKLLAEYYLSQKCYQDAISLLKPYYKANPKQFMVALVYVDALIATQQYALADKILADMDIIPYEGASNGQKTFFNLKLLQALEQIKQQKYSKALVFLEQSRVYPSNLASGKPYDEDIDNRLVDWLNYLCYERLNQKDNAKAMLMRITDYIPHTLAWGAPNVINEVVTAMAYDRLNRHDKALYHIKNESVNNKLLPTWYKAASEGNAIDLSSLEANVSAMVLSEVSIMSVKWL